MIRIAIFFAAAAAVAGGASARRPIPPQNGESAEYVCADGRTVEILYGGGIAVVTIADRPMEMKRAERDDVERYDGGGWQWSVAGKREGSLTAPGAPAGVRCRAA